MSRHISKEKKLPNWDRLIWGYLHKKKHASTHPYSKKKTHKKPGNCMMTKSLSLLNPKPVVRWPEGPLTMEQFHKPNRENSNRARTDWIQKQQQTPNVHGRKNHLLKWQMRRKQNGMQTAPPPSLTQKKFSPSTWWPSNCVFSSIIH